MAKIKSVFGAYADRLQVMIDNSLDKFAPTWFEKYFDFGVPQASLTFVTAIGRSRIEAAASIVDRDSGSPLRSRAALEKLSGTIPAIKEKIKMSEEDYRNFLTLQNMSVSDQVKKQQLLDYMFGDVRIVGNSALKRLDYMCLEGVSKGEITVTIDNNPDGVVAPTAIDLFMPAANKKNAAGTWETAGSATPFTDILTVVEAGDAKGIKFEKMLITRSRFLKMIKTTEVKEHMAAFLRLNVTKVMPTLNNINEFMAEQGWPQIELVEATIGIEKDGVITAVKPWKDENVAFIPAGKLGRIHNAVAIEQLKPVASVNYAQFRNALISKWSENEPFAEYTKVEMNAFPGIDAIDSIFLLSTTAAF
jgi:hypothetical protein